MSDLRSICSIIARWRAINLNIYVTNAPYYSSRVHNEWFHTFMNNGHHRNKEILWKTIHATNFVRGTPWKQLIGGCIIQPHTLCYNVLTTGYGHPLWYWDTKSCKKIANFCLLSLSSLRWQMALIGYPILSYVNLPHDCALTSAVGIWSIHSSLPW